MHVLLWPLIAYKNKHTIRLTSKHSQFSDDIPALPGSNRISLPLYQFLNILRSIPLTPPSPPWDQRLYHFCQSQFPSAFVIPAHIYQLSIAVSECKITDVLRGGIGWDYLALSINAYFLFSSLLCHHSLINLRALWGCNVFVEGGGCWGSAVGGDGVLWGFGWQKL